MSVQSLSLLKYTISHCQAWDAALENSQTFLEEKAPLKQKDLNILASILSRLNDTENQMVDLIADGMSKFRRTKQLTAFLSHRNDQLIHVNITATSSPSLTTVTSWLIKLTNILASGSYVPLGSLIAHFAQFLPVKTFTNDIANSKRVFTSIQCQNIRDQELRIHQFFAKLGHILNIGNDTFKISLFELPTLVDLPDRRIAKKASIRERAFFSHCSALQAGFPLNLHSARRWCFQQWDRFISEKDDTNPCYEGRHSECCIWRDIFGDKLSQILTVMKHAKLRANTFESLEVRMYNVLFTLKSWLKLMQSI